MSIAPSCLDSSLTTTRMTTIDVMWVAAGALQGASRVACAFLVYMLSPLPRHSDGRSNLAHPFRRVSLPRLGRRVGLCIGLFEAYSAFTRVTACTLALATVIRGPLSEGFSHFVTSMTAPVASGGSISPGGAFTHWKSAALARRTPNGAGQKSENLSFNVAANRRAEGG